MGQSVLTCAVEFPILYPLFKLFFGSDIEGLAETVLFAEQEHIDKQAMLNLINDSPLASGVTRQKSQTILSNDFSPAFALKHITKDLRLLQKEGMTFPLFSSLLNSYQSASQMGFGEEDSMSIIRFLDKSVSDKVVM